MKRALVAAAVVGAALIAGDAQTTPKKSGRPLKQYTIEQFYAASGGSGS